ncbi:neuromedin-U isoform X2 [Balaenoptera ricei]|uniref:neuromedin-U isoform X2 n=1 Tax=Balaenoptera ricei TaxID=2746895 RepID=UPI0028BDA64D|nr:neuromedin-U isoform X2 [Balaenoptera ricei]XP_059780076.1 neuromedin-U isoform X2 [Balaenoptera ricei]XP_059780077.1 neuromedin-U isoform X2 [Balaenoptera ricei]XP_059780078.1 neuromedin-U isoform X2 [Balaenoptera ricei]XP_059780079.1 neuromedin-U isoform X2 [Balaenoptera ricei]
MLVCLSCPWILCLRETSRPCPPVDGCKKEEINTSPPRGWPFQGILQNASSALEELCFIIMGTLPKPQETDEKDNTKRFLFHYSKTQKLGNSNAVSSVLHPLLQLVPQLHEKRMKRFKVDEEFQGPITGQSRGFFLFRPRNGRRSEGYI